MNYATIKPHDVANGPGVRVSLFVSGCTHHCEGCFNQEAWDFSYGKTFTKETIQYILECLKPSYIQGLSLLGGEPFEHSNQKELVELIKRVKNEYPSKNIWVYTGFTYDLDLVEGGTRYTEVTDEILDRIDILVDGKFIQELKNYKLKFRGSENQRIIEMKKTRSEGRIILSPLNNSLE